MTTLKSKVYAPDPLNAQATVIVDAQTDIKIIVKNGALKGVPFSVIQEKVRQVIEKAVKRLASNTLKMDAKNSLTTFANGLYYQMKTAFPDPLKAFAVYTLVKAITASKQLRFSEWYIPKTNVEKTAFKTLYGETFYSSAKGIPLQEFQKTYIDRVKTALSKMSETQALDPNDVTGRNSLRNLAEMQVRYERHLQDIQDLKDKGVNLVVCSVHGDCSERCSKWQGRVYSLDGTYGTTEDGRKYVPLEEATDIYYTTKSGRTYKNGLLGFNCRHKLYPYKVGMLIPTVSAKEQIIERDITRRQRALERNVLHWREEALMQKGVDVDEYKKSREKARYWYEEYKKYSKANGRAYYPDRVRVL